MNDDPQGTYRPHIGRRPKPGTEAYEDRGYERRKEKMEDWPEAKSKLEKGEAMTDTDNQVVKELNRVLRMTSEKNISDMVERIILLAIEQAKKAEALEWLLNNSAMVAAIKYYISDESLPLVIRQMIEELKEKK